MELAVPGLRRLRNSLNRGPQWLMFTFLWYVFLHICTPSFLFKPTWLSQSPPKQKNSWHHWKHYLCLWSSFHFNLQEHLRPQKLCKTQANEPWVVQIHAFSLSFSPLVSLKDTVLLPDTAQRSPALWRLLRLHQATNNVCEVLLALIIWRPRVDGTFCPCG